MSRTLKLTAVVLCLCLVAPAAYAQGRCSLQSFAGTYVSYDRGSSLTIELSSVGVLGPAPGIPPSPPAWVAKGFVPYVNIALVTYTPEGVGDGYFWMWAGTVSATLEPIPLHIIVTEMNEDCTGKFQYTLANGATIEERFIIFDNGRQYRSVPMTLAGPAIPTLTWIGTGHRISKDSAPVNSCGPQTAHGRYLLNCENIMRSWIYPQMAVAANALLLRNVSMTGDYTGAFYEKFGMSSTDGRPSWGTIAVNQDCSFSGALYIEGTSPYLVEKGVFFNEGKELYSMAILNPNRPVDPDQQGMKYSFCHGTRIGQ